MMLMQDPPIVEPSVPDIRTTTIFLNESPVYLNPLHHSRIDDESMK